MADDAIQLHEAAQRRSRPKNRSWSITCPAARMRRIIRPRSGSRRSAICTCSTTGWNKLRETIFDNQKRLGVIPAGCEADPVAEGTAGVGVAELGGEETLHQARWMSIAAYLAYTDHEIGRVIQAVEDMGKLDNTLIIYISGDNGASAEGTLNGTPNELAPFNGVTMPVKDQFLWYEFWGSDQTYPHMAVAWAWAFDTPFKWTKQVASHFGGTRQGICMSWPGHIKDVGGIRTQFHHVIDIVPTILEAAGIPAPDTINGIKQHPIEGVSMVYTWDKANAMRRPSAPRSISRSWAIARSITTAGLPRPPP